ncbi:MAG: hypothetical protein QOG35_1989 [Solirubrobacteraceae bacterium]|nr:hypothetical protein [Solirubrobacteraceae bacterium]
MRRTAPFALLLVVAASVAACGSSDRVQAPPPQPAASGKPTDFPDAAGRSMDDLLRMADGQGPILEPSVSLLKRGVNRYGFALFDSARKQITGAQVAIYTARGDGTGLRGPYVARSESLEVRPQFQSQTSSSDPNAAKSVYVSDVPFRRDGKQAVIGIAKLDGRLLVTSPAAVEVGAEAEDGPPWPGQRAIRVHTQTLTDVGGNAAAIDTRRPPATDLLQQDLAAVLGKRPVVITFATPLLCQSRVCGPTVDVVEQVKATAPRNVAFIHQEIYKDNRVDAGVRAQVAAWRLRSEPWTFVIDRRGRVSTRFEGAFSVGELERAVAKVAGGGRAA